MPLTLNDYNPSTERVSDRTPYDNHGINYGAIITSEGADFNGVNNYIEIENSTILEENYSEFTVSIWAKMYGDQDGWGYMVHKNSNQYEGSAPFVLAGAGTSFRWQIDNRSARVSSSSGLDDGNWYHIVSIWDGDYIHMYLNGELVDSEAHNSFTNNNGYITIGSTRYSPSYRPFWGQMSNLRVYNRAITSEEIKLLYARDR